MCFGCPKESSHRDGSFEYPQHMFWFRNKKNIFQICTLIWGPEADSHVYMLTLIVLVTFYVLHSSHHDQLRLTLQEELKNEKVTSLKKLTSYLNLLNG